MATIVIQRKQNKNGVSYAVQYRDPVTGQKQHYRSYSKKRDADHARNELRIKLDNGGMPEPRKKISPYRFSEVVAKVIEEWNIRLSVGEIREKTHSDYVITANLLNKEFGRILLCEMTEDKIKDYRLERARTYSNVASNRTLFILEQILKKGVDLGGLKYNPAESIKYLSEKKHKRNRFLMPNELDELIKAAKEGRAKYYLPALICLGAEHGASKQECLSLKWSDIDFNYHQTGMIRFFRTKNQHERTEFLMPRTKKELMAWRDHLEKKRKKFGLPGLSPDDHVFCRIDGQPIESFKKGFAKACEDAGIRDFRFHDLRHTFCSNLVLSGADLKDAKEMIGHADIGMTDRYSHLTAQHKLLMQRQLTEHYENNVKGS